MDRNSFVSIFFLMVITSVKDEGSTGESVCTRCWAILDAYCDASGKRCKRCRRCTLKNQHRKRPCGRYSDTLCECNNGWYYSQENTLCLPWRKCGLGYEVSKIGTPETNVECSPCLKGTFSNDHSTTSRCRQHTKCGALDQITPGNSTHDTVCGPPTTTETPTFQTPTATVGVGVSVGLGVGAFALLIVIVIAVVCWRCRTNRVGLVAGIQEKILSCCAPAHHTDTNGNLQPEDVTNGGLQAQVDNAANARLMAESEAEESPLQAAAASSDGLLGGGDARSLVATAQQTLNSASSQRNGIAQSPPSSAPVSSAVHHSTSQPHGNSQHCSGNPQPHGNSQHCSGNPQPHGNSQHCGGNPQPHGNSQHYSGNPQPHGNSQHCSANPQPHGNSQHCSGNPQPHGNSQHCGGNPQHHGNMSCCHNGCPQNPETYSKKKSSLANNRVYFRKNLCPDEIYDYLIQAGVMSSREQECIINQCHSREDRSSKLIRLLLSRDDNAIDVLKQALNEVPGQAYLAQKLEYSDLETVV